MADTLRVALTQGHVTPDLDTNVAAAVELVAEAGRQRADLVLLPENALMLGTNQQMREAALRMDAPEIERLRAAARRAGTAVVLGGFKHLHEAGVHNTALVIGADGEIAGGYDKIHLFDATVAGRSFEASSVEQRGVRPMLVRLGNAVVGLTICYDVRFPELYRQLALAGSHVFLVPAAFTAKTGHAHWEVLLRSRAIENGAYVIASATISGAQPEEAFPTYGHALAVDPWGRVLADLGEQDHTLEVLDLDLTAVHDVRDGLPVLRGVQPEAYATPPGIIDLEPTAIEVTR